MWHVPDDDQLWHGLANYPQEPHHVRMAAKFGKQLSFSQKVFLHSFVSIICEWLQSLLSKPVASVTPVSRTCINGVTFFCMGVMSLCLWYAFL